MPPPFVNAALPLIVTFVSVIALSFWMPPPMASEKFPVRVAFVSVMEPVMSL
jgi:hypothetical protein